MKHEEVDAFEDILTKLHPILHLFDLAHGVHHGDHCTKLSFLQEN